MEKRQNKKKARSFIIKLILFLLVLFVCFQIVNEITKRKYAYQRMSDFFSQKEDFDVLFFGSSHMIDTVLPMELWKKYGMISYNLGTGAETAAISYHNMKLALKETKPKLIVFDAFHTMSENKVVKSALHDVLDAYPISIEKYTAIQDLFDGEDLFNNEFEFLFPFSTYHARWDELKREDFIDLDVFEKGAKTVRKHAVPNEMSDFNSIQPTTNMETINITYFRKIIEYCKDNNIDILITYIPFPASDENIANSKYIGNICKEYNVNYINFLNMDIVDYDIDCHDADSHLNISGARKVTDYLGKYIMENYDIPNQKDNADYSFWNDDYNKYINYKIKKLKNNNERIEDFLIQLYNEEDIKYEITISKSLNIKENSLLNKLLNNGPLNYEVNNLEFIDKDDKNIKIVLYDKRNGKLIDTLWF